MDGPQHHIEVYLGMWVCLRFALKFELNLVVSSKEMVFFGQAKV